LIFSLLPEQLDNCGDLLGAPSGVLLCQIFVVMFEEVDIVTLGSLGNGLCLNDEGWGRSLAESAIISLFRTTIEIRAISFILFGILVDSGG
jgi:hypothetical protein